MTISTTDRAFPSEWHIERIRVWWDRFREWDTDHQMWSDTGVVVVLLVACLTFPGGFVQHGPKEILFQAALLLPLIWRRRAPSLVFSLIAGVAFVQWLTFVPLPADVALLVALFTLAVHADPRRALLGAGVVFAGVLMASVRWSPAGDVVKSIVFLTGLLVAALFVGIALRTWHSYMDSLLERTKRLEHERDQQAMLAAATERSRIAREMHDVIAHSVSIMVTLADGALATVDSQPEESERGHGRCLGDRSSGTHRHAPPPRRASIRRFGRRSGTPAPAVRSAPAPRGCPGHRTGSRVRTRGVPFEVPPGVELTVFRIVQESLTNVLKHAQEPTVAQVTLTFDAPFVDVRVLDDGTSTKPCSEGHGLGGMNERATISGGTLKAGPNREGGWEVRARVRADR